MSRHYRLLVFDWDGTLIDSQTRIVHCLAAAARRLGAADLGAAGFGEVIGLGLAEAVRRLYPDADAPFLRDYTQAYRDEFLSSRHPPSTLFGGAKAVVEALREAGYTLAIATGKSRPGLDRELREQGLGEAFVATRCADETRSKPDPLMLHELFAHTGIPPSEALMIGDSVYDMLLARNAGSDALAVSYGVHALERLLEHGPRGHIDHIHALPAWLAEASGQADTTPGAEHGE
jgi:phosphoglycolate phosphatase